jgi:hypothetical protein
MTSLPLPSRIRRGMVAAGLRGGDARALPGRGVRRLDRLRQGRQRPAGGDGGSQYQVTLDGTSEHPYRSPSQADDGTIAAGHGTEILRMKQNGTVLDRLDPPMLMNSVSHPMDGTPVDVAISPDGTKVAYSFYG